MERKNSLRLVISAENREKCEKSNWNGGTIKVKWGEEIIMAKSGMEKKQVKKCNLIHLKKSLVSGT